MKELENYTGEIPKVGTVIDMYAVFLNSNKHNIVNNTSSAGGRGIDEAIKNVSSLKRASKLFSGPVNSIMEKIRQQGLAQQHSGE